MDAHDGVEEHESKVVPRRRDILELGGLVPLSRLSAQSDQKGAALKGPPHNDRELKKVYADAGHTERWTLLRYDVAHQETPEGRQQIIAFLQRFM